MIVIITIILIAFTLAIITAVTTLIKVIMIIATITKASYSPKYTDKTVTSIKKFQAKGYHFLASQKSLKKTIQVNPRAQ